VTLITEPVAGHGYDFGRGTLRPCRELEGKRRARLLPVPIPTRVHVMGRLQGETQTDFTKAI
jgi:hypothetical protein